MAHSTTRGVKIWPGTHHVTYSSSFFFLWKTRFLSDGLAVVVTRSASGALFAQRKPTLAAV